MEITLKKPLEKDGKTIEKLTINIDKLTGNDIMNAENEVVMRGNKSPNPLFTSEGFAVIAAKASGNIPEDIFALSAPDFLLVTSMVQNFLFGWALTTGMQSNN
jgi:hypothetical protein